MYAVVFSITSPRIVDREITHIINESKHVSEIYLIRVFLGTNFSCKPNPGYLDDAKILIEPIRIISAVWKPNKCVEYLIDDDFNSTAKNISIHVCKCDCIWMNVQPIGMQHIICSISIGAYDMHYFLSIIDSRKSAKKFCIPRTSMIDIISFEFLQSNLHVSLVHFVVVRVQRGVCYNL